ncbi:FadR/GntR family transcriptional regulator [Microbacterium sulfonylureivorans]|uniref:FadR/GntR family transcriptional regulator n=1 Tax=Microbacterium sulfonylureivorans TaxID=2486854 RepID=UPI000FDC099F|nr:FadR/GntR family transcriptional regulator [Microbacterium sulfonylureivorans]
MSTVASPLQRTSLASMAADELIRLIEERGYRENDALPSTAELESTLQVSRTVVREAIAELAGQGLLRRQQGRETVVSLPDASQLERLLRLRFAVQGADFPALQDFRQIIEVGAARIAAERATDEDIAALQDKLEKLRSANGDEALHTADQAFHREVARISGNDLTLLTIDGITPLLHQLRLRAWAGWTEAGQTVDPIIEAHAAILAKIRERDPEGAAEAMRSHLHQAYEGLRHSATAQD